MTPNKKFTNLEITELLRDVAASCQPQGKKIDDINYSLVNSVKSGVKKVFNSLGFYIELHNWNLYNKVSIIKIIRNFDRG